MKQSTIIKILSTILAVIVLSIGFVLFTDNNISKAIFSTTTTTKPATTTTRPPKTQIDPVDLMNTDLSKYVTLGQYTGHSLDVEITESDYAEAVKYVKENIKNILMSDDVVEKITEGVIEENVTFSFDFTGYLNGEAFEGGSATNTYAYIKDGKFNIVGGLPFIEGFAEGILGAEVGSEFEINATFPDNYGVAELNGKTVVFAIKINHILGEIDFNDEWINRVSEGKYATCDEYVADYIARVYKSNSLDLIQDEVIKLSTVIDIPQQEFDYYYNDFRYTIEGYAIEYGMTYEAFISTYGAYFFGLASDDDVKQYARDVITAELVSLSIAKAENITASEEEFRAYVDNILSQYDITEEELFKDYPEEKIYEEIIMQKVSEWLMENNELVIKIVPDKTESTN